MKQILILIAAVAVFGCKGEVGGPTPNKSQPLAPLFAVGSAEQSRLDRFLARFPQERSDKFREIFATGSSRLSATNPELQREINAIYADLDKADAAKPAFLTRRHPGPVEASLIDQLVATLPVAERENAKLSLYTKSAVVTAKDPERAALLDAIYKARAERK